MVQQIRREGHRRGMGEKGRSRRHKRKNGGEGGIVGSLYLGQAARRRVPQSAGAELEEAAHLNLLLSRLQLRLQG